MKRLVLAVLALLLAGEGAAFAKGFYRRPVVRQLRVRQTHAVPVVIPAPAPPAPQTTAPPATPPVRWVMPAPPKPDPAKVAAQQAKVQKDLLAFQQMRAAEGSPPAQYSMALRYLTGDGVNTDAETARSYLKKAADSGYLPARSKLDELDHPPAAAPAEAGPAPEAASGVSTRTPEPAVPAPVKPPAAPAPAVKIPAAVPEALQSSGK
jgi:hypothetical protein